MGSGPVGQTGASVHLPVYHKTSLPLGLANARALTPPPHQTHVDSLVWVKPPNQKAVTTCLTAQVHLSACLSAFHPSTIKTLICLQRAHDTKAMVMSYSGPFRDDTRAKMSTYRHVIL